MIRIILSLLVVFGGLLAVKLWLSRSGLTTRPGLRVIARVPVAKNVSVAVLEVGQGRCYLVGASDQGVTMLDRLDAETAAELLHDSPASLPSGEAAPQGVIDLENGDRRSPGAEPSAMFEGWRMDASTTRPGSGLVQRLREMTVRAPARIPPDARLR